MFAGNHLFTTHARTCERMLRHGAVYRDNCGVVWVLRTTWCSRRAVYPKELGLPKFSNISKFICRFLVLRENAVSCWKVTSKAALPRQSWGSSYQWWSINRACSEATMRYSRTCINFFIYWCSLSEPQLSWCGLTNSGYGYIFTWFTFLFLFIWYTVNLG